MASVILLISLGLLLFLIEFLLIPGITIAGIGGAIFTISGIYLAFSKFGTQTGAIVLISTMVGTVIIFAISLRARTWKKAMLTTNIDSKVNEIPGNGKINPSDKGITVTRMAPIGTIKVNGIIIEAKSISGFIDQKVEIEVVKVTSSQIIVKLIN